MRKSSCSSAASSRIRRRGSWTPEEDQKLLAFIQQHGHGNWHSLPQKAGLQRCGKSCRLRWINYLRPDIKRGNFSLHEDQTIIRLHALLGNRWSAIAAQLPKRTDNEIKNYWNTNLKKRLAMIGLDPVTHKPKATANVLASAGGGDPKYLSNLTHIAQWESTRLQAEASFSRNYSKLTRRHDDITIPPPASDSSLELEYLYYCKPDHDHHESAAAVPPPQWYYDIPTAWESVLLSKSIAAAAAPGGEDGGGAGGATNVTQDPVSFGPATLICAASISSMVDNAETTTGSLDFNQVLGQLGNEYYCTTSTSTSTSPPTTQLLAALHRNMGFGSFEVRDICLDDFGTIL